MVFFQPFVHQVLQRLTWATSPASHRTQVGILLPFSRTQESEADTVGLELMARAGFDPRQSVDLWRNMAEASGGGGQAEFLSTHPSNDSRINNLSSHMDEAMQLYRQAPNHPDCG